ncbi:unnamed protein product [Agarophyton chilense]
MPVIHQFLFGPFEAAESMVPHDRPESLSALLQVSAQEMMPVRYGRIFDHSHNINFRCTPAINVGSVALGYCSVQYLDGDGRKHLHMRYARDDTNGKLLAVSAPMVDIVELEMVTFHSTRRRTRVNARLDAFTFQQACETEQVEEVIKGLHAISSSRQWRPCPVCGRNEAMNLDDEGSGDCACALPLSMATEAFDFRNDRANMAFQAGRFYGDCVLRVLEEGAVKVEARLVSQMWTRSTTDLTRLMGGQLAYGGGGGNALTSESAATAALQWAVAAQPSGAGDHDMQAILTACSQAQTTSSPTLKIHSATINKDGGATVMNERARKLELRKERNRMAAARSNAKRKERTDLLRDQLHDELQREHQLREREAELRRDNVSLRRLVGGQRSNADVAARLAHVVAAHQRHD